MNLPVCPVDRLFAVDYDEWVERVIRGALQTRTSQRLEFDLFDVEIDYDRSLVTVADVLQAGVECTTTIADFVMRLDAADVPSTRFPDHDRPSD